MARKWYLIRCAFILGWRSFVIYLASWILPKEKHRLFVNQMTQQGAKDILGVVKANYSIEYTDPASIKPDQTYIFMCNHQSLFDLPLLYAALAKTIRPIVKKELLKIPVFGRALRKSECIPVDRKNPQSRDAFLQTTHAAIQSGISLLFFPEGTRSRTNQLLPFKTGGFHLARFANISIVPVGIINSSAILPPGKLTLNLYKHVKIKVGDPIDIASFKEEVKQLDLIEKVKASIENLIRK